MLRPAGNRGTPIDVLIQTLRPGNTPCGRLCLLSLRWPLCGNAVAHGLFPALQPRRRRRLSRRARCNSSDGAIAMAGIIGGAVGTPRPPIAAIPMGSAELCASSFRIVLDLLDARAADG